MTYKENVTAILECNFAGFKQEIIDTAVDCIMALSAEPCRTADDYENEIADLHNRLDIAEYDKERYKEEITTLEVKNKAEWIPVSERLPEEEYEVYCQLSDGSNAVLYVQDNWGQMEWVDGMMGTGTYDVVAWREKPEPYKAEKGGE